MSTIFPLSASVNQIFQGYRFNGEKWELIGIDLTADYPEIVDGKISASVIPDTFATVAYVDQEVSNVDLSSYLTASAASGTYLTQSSASTTYATKTELNNIDLSSASAAAVAAIVDSAPSTLDTLNELAAALGDDENFATTVTTSLAGKLDISSASNTYLTQVNASTTYATKTELQEIDLLPSQTGNDGKYLTTTGASAYWGELDIPPSAVLQSASPVGAEAGQIWVDSNASASYLNTNDFLLKADVPYTPVYLMNTGTTGERPTGSNGLFRFNTTTGYPEWYDESSGGWWNFYEQKVISVEYLVIAGGGAGGGHFGGGGGAGGYLTGTSTITSGSPKTITIGAGGSGVSGANRGNSGVGSVFGDISTTGGGGGGCRDGVAAGINGGSGGGGGGNESGGFSGGSGVSGQGNSGGSGRTGASSARGGGGGGATGVGQDANAGDSARGGTGASSSITGTSVTRAGGGAGAGGTGSGSGGTGGGGGYGTAGTANTGSGGGGANISDTSGSGGSGVVIIAYPSTYGNLTVDPGLTYTLDTSGRSGYKVYTFTSGTGTVDL